MKYALTPTARMAALAALIAGLSACGGGGGGGSGAALVPTPLAITSANYVVAAQESLSSALSISDSSKLLTGAQVSPDQVALAFARAQIPKLGRWLSGLTPVVVGVVMPPVTEPCQSGSMTVTVNDVNNNQVLDAGDAFTIVSQSCMFSGATLNGTMAFVVNSYTGDIVNSDLYTIDMAMTLTNLAATDVTGTVTANGSMHANLVSTGVNNSVFGMTTSNYAEVSVRAGVTYNRTLTDFTSTLTTTPDGAGFTESLSANGTLASSGLDNHTVVFATLTPIVRSSSQTYPSSGSATITGASGSNIRLTVLDGTSVELKLDADGNSVFETTQTKLWTDLL